jgi:hypothetical protein
MTDMDDAERGLTETDRRAIAEIRRKLDAEFGSFEEAGHVHWTTHRARHRALAAALLLGMSAAAGVMLRYSDRATVLSHPRIPAQKVDSRNDSAPTPWVLVSDVALLREALNEWIEATRRGDITTQMRFYPAQVPVYYTWRNVRREAVHAEKVKIFGSAHHLVITTDQPAIEVAQDGRTATTRFRKRYVIEGPAIRRHGEVLQELRWARTMGGWLIVGERDARVLRPG